MRDAFQSINEFINEESQTGEHTSGINFEKSLISDNIFRETWSEKQEEFIEQLIYPTTNNDYQVDDAFGIFVGFEISIDEHLQQLPNSDFRVKIREKINRIVDKRISNIENYIQDLKLYGYNFYIYLMPFIDIDVSRKKILEDLIK